jgi:hypothetical protein
MVMEPWQLGQAAGRAFFYARVVELFPLKII